MHIEKILESFEGTPMRITDDQLKDFLNEALYGLSERSIAIESVLFIHTHLRYIKNRIMVNDNIRYLCLTYPRKYSQTQSRIGASKIITRSVRKLSRSFVHLCMLATCQT